MTKKQVWFRNHIALLTALAGPALATLELPDQLDVSGGGLGPVIASFEAITNEVGFVVDDTFDGEITFKWTMKWDVLEGGTAYESFALFHFFTDPEGRPVTLENESIGIGTVWNSTKISMYKEPGSDDVIREVGEAIREGQTYDFTLVVDYHAGAHDTARISGGGFFNQPLGPGDWSFHHIRARVGGKGQAPTQADFTHISITSSGRSGTRSTGQVDLLPYITGKKTGVPHQELYFRKLECAAMRDGQWKLIRIEKYGFALYNLENDINEQHDLAAQMPQKVEELRKKLEAWETGTIEPHWSEGDYWANERLKYHKAWFKTGKAPGGKEK